MSDVGERISESVHAPRASAKQHGHPRGRREAGGAGRQQDRQRASELSEQVWERVRAAAHAADGAILVSRNRGAALTTFRLWCPDGQPDRALQIVVDELKGFVKASWVLASGHGQSVDAPTVEASRFDLASLESVIELFVEQRRWARGAVPMIPC